MFDSLPGSAIAALDWGKDNYKPFFEDLLARKIDAATVEQWLQDLTRLAKLAMEVRGRLYVATTVDTTDAEVEARHNRFFDEVFPLLQMYEDQLNRKLLDSGLEPAGLEIPLRNIRADVELFREENVPLLAEEQKLALEYAKVVGAQTVEWEGQEITLAQLRPVYQDTDRARREKAWRRATDRWLQDREALNALWQKLMAARGQIVANTGLPDYRTYRWQQLHRFDYTPEDGKTFQQAIEAVAVPAAARVYERRRARLGVETVRPWDTDVDPQGRDPLRPFDTIEQLETGVETIFARLDPQLRDYFKIMRDENLFDLENRKGKAPGGYCEYYPLVGRAFIFMNAVGLHDDVLTLLHEGGHGFHAFELNALPYIHQYEIPLEFAEVASTTMELMAAPYLVKDQGGFYSEEEAARARVEHLEGFLAFWPYMAVVDAFQNWVYTHHETATDPARCDAKWGELWDRYMVGLDYSGFDDVKVTGWQRKEHIFEIPFYYIEYGLAQLGAIQVWAKALADQPKAVRDYLKALALGGTVTLPGLFATAGARFAFDAETVSSAVRLMETTIHQLDPT